MKRNAIGGVSRGRAATLVLRTSGVCGLAGWAAVGWLAGVGESMGQAPATPERLPEVADRTVVPSAGSVLPEVLREPVDGAAMTNGIPDGPGILPGREAVTVEYVESRLPEVPLEAPAVALAGGTQQGTDVLRWVDPMRSSAGGRSAPGASIPPVFRWGPLTAHPRLGYAFSHGTGLQGVQGQSDATLSHTFSPGIGLDVGRYWVVDYAPTAIMYDSPQFRDTVNHAVSLNGSVPGRVWRLSAGGRYAVQDNPLIETGQQTETTQVSGNLGAGRSLTEVLSLTLGASYSLRDAKGFNTVTSWGSQNSLDYQFREHLAAGLVMGFGYDQIDPGSDMVSERVQGRLNGVLGEKFSYNVLVGLEVRQFQEGDSGSLLSPLFSGGIAYAATPTTSLGLSFQQSISPSFFNDELNQTTAVNATATQRLLEKLMLSVSGSYRWNERSSTANTSQQQGTDELMSVQVSLSTRVLRRGWMSVFWSWSDNASTQNGLGFSSEQVGVNVSYGF